MSGHSKWHNIQARKGKQDAKKSNVYTKIARLITVAAQKGGDPAMNFSLRLAIEKAKAASMPKDNIEKAIKRGTGELEGEKMESIMYEAFGPGGAQIIVKTLTDNKNRTVSDVKHLLHMAGGSLGGPGSVLWNFGEWGMVTIMPPSFAHSTGSERPELESKGAKEGVGGGFTRDDFVLSLIDVGAEDVIDVEDGRIEIRTTVANLQKVLQKLKELGVEPIESGLKFIAKEKATLSQNEEDRLATLFSELEAHDDVEDYFTNAE